MLKRDRVDVYDFNLVCSYLQALHIGKHGEGLPCADILANLVVLLQEDLVQDAVAHRLGSHRLGGLGTILPTKVPILHLLLHLQLVLQALDYLRFPDTVIQEETLDLGRETFRRNALIKQGLNEVLELDILVFLDRLDDAWAQMGLLLELVRRLLLLQELGLFSLPLGLQLKLLLLFCLLQDLEQLLDLVLVLALVDEFLGLPVDHVVFIARLMQLLLDSLRGISSFDDLLLQESFLPVLFVHLQLALLNRFLMHLGHVSKKKRLLSNLPQLALQRLNLLLLLHHVLLVIRLALELIDLLLDDLDVIPVRQHELIVLLLEGTFKAEVHEFYHLIESFGDLFDALATAHFVVAFLVLVLLAHVSLVVDAVRGLVGPF